MTPSLPVTAPSLPDTASALAWLAAVSVSQHARLITLAFATQVAAPAAFVVDSFTGREAVNDLFGFDIDLLSSTADLDLKAFLGEELTLRLLRADGTHRAWHGYCTRAARLGSDGALTRYRLHLAPFLALLALRRDSFLFQDKTTADIVDALLADYPQASHVFDLTRPLARRAICTQYRESDLDFLRRLLASEGLCWYFTHDQAEGAAASDTGARHRLVICDADAMAPAIDGGPVRFHRIAATERSDSITRFDAVRRVQSNAVTVSSWDPAGLFAPSASIDSALEAGGLPPLPVYRGAFERRHVDSAAAAQHAERLLQAQEAGNKVWQGGGAVRDMACGHAFELLQHEHYPPGANAFRLTWVSHAARNNLGEGLPQRNPGSASAPAALATPAVGIDIEHGTYRNQFGCVRRDVPMVPVTVNLAERPAAAGPQLARVVGLGGAAHTSDRNHRIKVQFAWQRGAQPVVGGLAHGGTDIVSDDGNAPGDERSGSWIRVAEALAGPNWGTVFVPRIGTEVLVDFIDGDIDRPLVVAQLYNGAHMPPFAAGIDASANHTGVLSGWHSKGVDGSGHNQWVLDDSAGQLRMRLATSSAASQLNLGYLVHQQGASGWRGSYRGHGFELRTDAWSVVRAAQGLLLSTALRPARGSSVTSTQMDAADAVSRFAAAETLAGVLGDAATHHQSFSSQPARDAATALAAGIDPAASGRHPDTVNGQRAGKPGADGNTPDAASPVERFARPSIVLDSAASINCASAASTLLYAGAPMQCTAQNDMHWSAGHTIASVSGEATSLFAHDGGIQAIAAHAPLSLHAHTDALEVLADDSLTVTSVNDAIEIKASKTITLQAGQASITLDGGNITFACPGQFSVKGAAHAFAGGASQAARLEDLPHQLLSFKPEPHSLRWQALSAIDGIAAKDVDVVAAEKVTGKIVHSGKTGADGRTARQMDEQLSKEYVALVGAGEWVTEITTNEDPIALDSSDWLDWEAEE